MRCWRNCENKCAQVIILRPENGKFLEVKIGLTDYL
jgi:hypothetical protein